MYNIIINNTIKYNLSDLKVNKNNIILGYLNSGEIFVFFPHFNVFHGDQLKKSLIITFKNYKYNIESLQNSFLIIFSEESLQLKKVFDTLYSTIYYQWMYY